MDRRKSAGSAVGSRARQVSGAPSSVSNPYGASQAVDSVFHHASQAALKLPAGAVS